MSLASSPNRSEIVLSSTLDFSPATKNKESWFPDHSLSIDWENIPFLLLSIRTSNLLRIDLTLHFWVKQKNQSLFRIVQFRASKCSKGKFSVQCHVFGLIRLRPPFREQSWTASPFAPDNTLKNARFGGFCTSVANISSFRAAYIFSRSFQSGFSSLWAHMDSRNHSSCDHKTGIARDSQNRLHGIYTIEQRLLIREKPR